MVLGDDRKVIKAKKTEYGGILFRSRLEARWAVFFDTIGLKYEYEPKIPTVYYLPDFLFLDIAFDDAFVYVEVKYSISYLQRKMIDMLEKTGHYLLLLDDLPDCKSYSTFHLQEKVIPKGSRLVN